MKIRADTCNRYRGLIRGCFAFCLNTTANVSSSPVLRYSCLYCSSLRVTRMQDGHNRRMRKSFWQPENKQNRCLPLLVPEALANSLSPSDSLLQVRIHSTAEIVTQVPHLSFSETCWLVLSVNLAFGIHIVGVFFYPVRDEYLLLIHNGMCIQCECAACLWISGTVNEVRCLYFSPKYFSCFWLPGSFMYPYYLLSSPRARLHSIDKNWFLSCE